MIITPVRFICMASLVFLQACSLNSDEQAAEASADGEHAEIVKRDLFAIISLQGSPCQQVVSYDIQQKLDYIATCETGDRYRIHVSSEGKVHVNPHEYEE